MAHPIAVVMMGVTGSGKSVVGTALATRLGARFIVRLPAAVQPA